MRSSGPKPYDKPVSYNKFCRTTVGMYRLGILIWMFCRGRLQPSTMVHEEEEGVSMSLFMLLGQAAHAAVPAEDEPLPDLPPPPPLAARQVGPSTLPAAVGSLP